MRRKLEMTSWPCSCPSQLRQSVTLKEEFCRNPQDKLQQTENKYVPHQLFPHKASETRNLKQIRTLSQKLGALDCSACTTP